MGCLDRPPSEPFARTSDQGVPLKNCKIYMFALYVTLNNYEVDAILGLYIIRL